MPPQDRKTMPESNDRIVLSRQVVYFQVALLAVLPLTCFVLGWMMGSLTASSGTATANTPVATLTGSVIRSVAAQNRIDAGATVLVLPVGAEFAQRRDPNSIHPASFQPLDNPLIEAIQQVGGGVVRTIEDGTFRLQVAGPGDYWLIVVATSSTTRRLELSRTETAALSRFFLPLEGLFAQHEFLMMPIQVTGDYKDLGKLVIDR